MNYARFYKNRRTRASERAKRGWVTRHASMSSREPTADDLRHRAARDRRGDVYATLQCTNHMTGKVTRIVLRHSVKGRADQFDLTVNGKAGGNPCGLVEIMKKWRGAISS